MWRFGWRAMSKTLVAAPILEYSPLLSDADLMEIIACGQVQQDSGGHGPPPSA